MALQGIVLTQVSVYSSVKGDVAAYLREALGGWGAPPPHGTL